MPTRKQGHELSRRERQVVELAARGLTDTAIAHELGISEATVTTYWERVRSKYGQHSRTELVFEIYREKADAILRYLSVRNQWLVERLRNISGMPSEQLCRQLIEEAADAILLIDANGGILQGNESAAVLFGYPVEELRGMRHDLLVPEDRREAHRKSSAAFVRHPEKGRMGDHKATLARRGDGRAIAIHATLTPVETGHGLLIMCVLRRA